MVGALTSCTVSAPGKEEMNMKKLYLVVELYKSGPPRIIGLFRSKKKAEQAAYGDQRSLNWRNVIPLKVVE